MSGNHLPNPIPPRVRRHSSLAHIPHMLRRSSPEHARGGARNAMVAAPYRRFAQDSLIRAAPCPSMDCRGLPYSDRRIEHALNPASHRRVEPGEPPPQGARHVRTPHDLRGTPQPRHRDRRGPLGGLQLRPRPPGPPLVRHLAHAAPPVRPWASRPSPPPAGCCCAVPNRARPGCCPRSLRPPLAEEQPPHRGHRHRAGAGAHRGGRHAGGSAPVD